MKTLIKNKDVIIFNRIVKNYIKMSAIKNKNNIKKIYESIPIFFLRIFLRLILILILSLHFVLFIFIKCTNPFIWLITGLTAKFEFQQIVSLFKSQSNYINKNF
jgi:hypothetical protein